MEYFTFFPDEITLDILTRLPTESVLICKSVCKPWNNLISHDLIFSKMHLNRLKDSGKLTFLLTFNPFYYFDYSETTHEINIRRIDLIPPQLYCYSLVGSCNGLICLHHYNGSIIISNPIIKEYYVILPEPALITNRDEHLFCGFGYLPITDEYKVVRMHKLQKEAKFFEVEVYTLGSGKGWRYLGKIECGFTCDIGVFAMGALHWSDIGKKRIVAFDLADEKFYDIPLPPIPHRWLWALAGSLMCIDDNIVVDRWLLKKKNGILGMKRPLDCTWVDWGKEFIPDDTDMAPFAFTKSGAVLCIKNLSVNSSLHCYDAKSSSVEKLASLGGCFYEFPIPHMNTLVSLKALGEEMELILGTKNRSLAEKHHLEGRSRDTYI